MAEKTCERPMCLKCGFNEALEPSGKCLICQAKEQYDEQGLMTIKIAEKLDCPRDVAIAQNQGS